MGEDPSGWGLVDVSLGWPILQGDGEKCPPEGVVGKCQTRQNNHPKCSVRRIPMGWRWVGVSLGRSTTPGGREEDLPWVDGCLTSQINPPPGGGAGLMSH